MIQFDNNISFREIRGLTDMAKDNIILPLTQFGEGNTGVHDIDTALDDVFTSNMKSNKGDHIIIAVPIYESSPVYNEQSTEIQIAGVVPVCDYKCIQIADAVIMNSNFE